MRPVYLDYAAATPLDPQVLKAMKPYFFELFYNPSATYLSGRETRYALQSARAAVAKTLGAKPSEIIFTAGATEANNLAIHGTFKSFTAGEILISAIEHESVFQPAALHKHKVIPVDVDGIIQLDTLQKSINDSTVLISVILVSNELGTLQPLNEISKAVKKIRKNRIRRGIKMPLYFHTDASAAANYISLNVSRLGVDLMSVNGGKIYGPKQSGILYARSSVSLQPIIVGGGQEQGLRAGTENVAGAIGFSEAFKLAQTKCRTESKRVQQLKNYFAKQLQNHQINFVINGSLNHCAPHILSITFPGIDNERLMMELDEDKIITAVGSACSAANDRPSRILSAISLTDELARSTLRFSLGRATSKADLDYTAKQIAKYTSGAR